MICCGHQAERWNYPNVHFKSSNLNGIGLADPFYDVDWPILASEFETAIKKFKSLKLETMNLEKLSGYI